jgi:hypothetical protein
VLSRMVGRILLVTVLWMSLIGFLGVLNSHPVSFAIAAEQVIQNRLYQAFLIMAMVFSARLILFRLGDRDVQ